MTFSYAVLRAGRAWRVFNPRGEVAEFTSRPAAEAVAAACARAAAAMGYEVQVLVQSPAGEMSPVDAHTRH